MTTTLSPDLTPTFTLEPTLPWLRTDPAMQQPEAFVGRRTIELNKAGWAPMSTYCPGGTTLAAVRITSMEDLLPGLYWHEHTPGADIAAAFSNTAPDGVIYSFGRFEGFGELTASQARRHKMGQAHITLGCDSLDCDLQAHCLREDGTQECFVNFGPPTPGGERKIWRITHYVGLSATALATLDAAPPTGLSPDQQRWLAEEQAILQDDASEFSAQVLGGFPTPDCRAVLYRENRDAFNCLLNSLPRLLPSQAKKRKPGAAVAITWRSYNYLGHPVSLTEYFKRADAALLLDWLGSVAAWWRVAALTKQHATSVLQAAATIRAARKARPASAPACQELAFEDAAQPVAELEAELAYAA